MTKVEFLKKLGMRIRDLRETVNEQTVSRWCTNYSQPSIPELFKIATYLKVSAPELLELPEKYLVVYRSF